MQSNRRMQSSGRENASWWKWLIADPPCEIGEDMTSDTFIRKCTKLYFNEKLSKAHFFHICSVVWMVKLFAVENVSPGEVWKSVTRCFQQGNDTMPKWILPSMDPLDLRTNIYTLEEVQEEDDNMRYFRRLVQFWRRLYETCNANNTGRPKKRRKTGYISSTSISFGDLMKGSYKLPAAYILVSIVRDCCCVGQNWGTLHEKVHSLIPKYFQAFTVEDFQAGLTLLGLHCIYKRSNIEGLTSTLILQNYVSRTA